MVDQLLQHKLVKNQVFRFVFSAGVGFLVDISVFYIFYHNLLTEHSYHLFSYPVRNSTISLAISFFMGVIVNFMITKFLVFQESQSRSSKQFIRFISVAIIGFFANLAVVKLLIQEMGIYPPYARVMAALSLFFASYFIHKIFSFSLSLRHAS